MLKIEWTRIDNNAYGNPRYVCHFLNLNTKKELDETPNDWNRISNLYALAVARAKRIGGKHYHTKKYGGGIVFVSYSLEETEQAIEKALAE